MTPSTVQQNALPDGWIDGLFARFAALYGRHWLDMWSGIPMAQVKATWAEAIGKIAPEQVKAGIAHVAERCKFPPTLPEFVSICRAEKIEPAHRVLLPAPRTEMPEHVRKQLAAFKAGHVRH